MDSHNRMLYHNASGVPPPPQSTYLAHSTDGIATSSQRGPPTQQHQPPPPSSQQSLPLETSPFQDGDDYPRHKRVRVSRAWMHDKRTANGGRCHVDICRRKKVRCDADGTTPCTNCRTYAFNCSFNDSAKKRGPPKGYIEALENRLKRMEGILGGLLQGGDAEAMEDLGDRDEDGDYYETGSESDDAMLRDSEIQQEHTNKTRKHLSTPASKRKPVTTPTPPKGIPRTVRHKKSSRRHHHDHHDYDMSSQSDGSSPSQEHNATSLEVTLTSATVSSTNTVTQKEELLIPSASVSSTTEPSNEFVSTPALNPSPSTSSASASTSTALTRPSAGTTANPLNERLENLRLDDSGTVRYVGNSSGLYLLTNKFLFNNGILELPDRVGVYLRKLSEEEYMVVNQEPIRYGDELGGVGASDTAVGAADRVVMIEGAIGRQFADNLNGSNSRITHSPEITKETSDRLIDLYFENIHDALPIINKPIFLRQYRAELSPPPPLLLLNAIYAIASRFDRDPSLRTDPDRADTLGADFFERAKMYLDRDYVHPRLSTVQALILISSHQNGISEGSGSWLHAGMAIRMAQDLGLHRNSSKWRIPQSEIETRKRCWWACYILDRYVKLLNLHLNLRPQILTILHSPYHRWSCAGLGRPLAIFDEDCDVEYPNEYDQDEEVEEAFITSNKTGQSTQIIRQSIDEETSSVRSSSTVSSNSSLPTSVASTATNANTEQTSSNFSQSRPHHSKRKSAVYGTFIQLIKLSEILGRVLQGLYSPKAHSLSLGLGSDSLVKLLDDSLTSWRLALPSELQYSPREGDRANEENGKSAPMGLRTGADTGETVAYSGPLYLCFYTILILLHRPFIPSRKNNQPRSSFPSLSICTSAATNIIHIAEKMKMRDFMRFSWSFSIYTVFQASLIHLHNTTNTDVQLAALANANLLRAIACLTDMKKTWHIAHKVCHMLKVLMDLRGAVAITNNEPYPNEDDMSAGVKANLSDVGRGKTPGRERERSVSNSTTSKPRESTQHPSTGMPLMQSAAAISPGQMQLSLSTASLLRNRGVSTSEAPTVTPPSSISPRSSLSPQILADASLAASHHQPPLSLPLSVTLTPSPLPHEFYSLRQFAIPTAKGEFISTDVDMPDFFGGPPYDMASGMYVTFPEGSSGMITPNQLFRNDPTNAFWGMPSSFDWDEWNSYMQGHGQQIQYEMEVAGQAQIVTNQASLDAAQMQAQHVQGMNDMP
ncbi:fungal-specific transcription factor domain-containing protein [Jimgerdemannia flammicorona]|uniref:Fungal-specific transcription factor domain-containing protein n=1 Tax=Jimgerdemannia flammicorona TaxID=994334 RepID=A0A433QKU4_9FUNG|nr:fungal-specific transcription factor domain-containing protein [Jimgerdemannia flammicorona]